MDFLILRPLSLFLSLKLNNTFLRGGGSKVFTEKAPSNGEANCCPIQPRSNGNTPMCKIFVRRLKSWSVDAGSGAAAIFAKPGFER